MRATWKPLTIVEPHANVSGSTSVWCCASESWNVSVLSFTRLVCACAGMTVATAIENANIDVKKGDMVLPLLGLGNVRFIRIILVRWSFTRKDRRGLNGGAFEDATRRGSSDARRAYTAPLAAVNVKLISH